MLWVGLRKKDKEIAHFKEYKVIKRRVIWALPLEVMFNALYKFISEDYNLGRWYNRLKRSGFKDLHRRDLKGFVHYNMIEVPGSKETYTYELIIDLEGREDVVNYECKMVNNKRVMGLFLKKGCGVRVEEL